MWPPHVLGAQGKGLQMTDGRGLVVFCLRLCRVHVCACVQACVRARMRACMILVGFGSGLLCGPRPGHCSLQYCWRWR